MKRQLPDIMTVEGEKDLVYDCYAVINHYGSMHFGHYTAYVKKDDGWYCADDSSFDRVDANKVVSEAAYVLFYRLRDN